MPDIKRSLVGLILLSSQVVCYGQIQDSVSVTITQKDVYVIKNDWSQQINFDFNIHNAGSEPIVLNEIQLHVYGEHNVISNVKTLRDGPLMPGIAMIPNRKIPGNEKGTIFNPFTDFNPHIDLSHLKFLLTFAGKSNKDFTIEIELRPKSYTSKSNFTLPLNGSFLVLDGGDLIANHRRFDVNHPLVNEVLDMHKNPQMFATDFVIVDSLGKGYSGPWRENTSHYIFGQPVYAPSGGRVIKTYNDYEDNTPGKMSFNINEVKNNKSLLHGNCVVIDHLNGEYSFLVHLKKGSVVVSKGDRVEKGQLLGKVGNSGSSNYPHLHYQVGDSPDYADCNGLPA